MPFCFEDEDATQVCAFSWVGEGWLESRRSVNARSMMNDLGNVVLVAVLNQWRCARVIIVAVRVVLYPNPEARRGRAESLVKNG